MLILREFAFVVVVLVVFASVISSDPGINVKWDIGTSMYFAISKYLMCLYEPGVCARCSPQRIFTYLLLLFVITVWIQYVQLPLAMVTSRRKLKRDVSVRCRRHGSLVERRG
jgi:hypothetical protein